MNYKVAREEEGTSVRKLVLWCKTKSLKVLSVEQPSEVLV